jgi:hypothetical protein
MWRETDTVAVTPGGVIAAIRREFGPDYAVSFDRLAVLIEEAVDPDSRESKNHIVRIIRMWIDIGLKPTDLLAAVIEMRGMYAETVPSADRRRNPHADELVQSDWPIPADWRTTIDKKIVRLKHLFGPLTVKSDFPSHQHRFDTEDFPCAVVPKPSFLASRHGIKDPYGAGYPDLLSVVVSAFPHSLNTWWPMTNTGAIAATILEKQLRLYERFELQPLTRTWLEKLEAETKGDLLSFPCQAGSRWRGSSMARVAWHAEHGDYQIGLFWREVPLPAYVALIELILQPRRLSSPGVLAIDCPGDIVYERFGYRANGLCLAYGHDTLHLLPRPRDRPDAMFASATALMR